MYALVSASVKLKDSTTGWVAKDIGNIPLRELFSSYSGIYAVLSNQFLPTNVAFNVRSLANDYADSAKTFNQYLIANGNLTLTTEPLANAVFEKKHIVYVDAFKADYNITNTAPNTPPDTNHAQQDKTWLVMSKEGVNNQTFYNRCMVNVNGFYHMIDYKPYGVAVVDGMKSNFISSCNMIGILSFGNIGTLEYVPITPDMLYKQTPEQEYKHTVCIDIGKDVSNKTLILVLGGYMHLVEPNLFRMIDSTRCMVNFANYPFMERYYESKKYIDLSSLNLETSIDNPDLRHIPDFYSDESIAAYFTLSQSFFVIVDKPDLVIEKKYVRKQLSPGQFISDIKPTLPLVVGKGKIANYWPVKHHTKWSLTCHDTDKDNLVFNKSRMSMQNAFSSNRVPEKPMQRSIAYFLDIYTET